MDKAIQQAFDFRGSRNNLPWVTRRNTREDLARFFATAGLVTGVEVGTQRGLWAKILCDANPALHLTCVDPWHPDRMHPQPRQEQFYASTVARLAGTGTVIWKMRSAEALTHVEDGTLDFAYIDAAHDFDNAAFDIISWARKVRRGGILAAHDYHITDVRCAIDAYTRCHHIIPWYLTSEPHGTAFWVVR